MTIDRAAQSSPIDPDDLTLEEVRGGILRGRHVSVLGLARSGIALARFLVDAGALVTVYDGRPAAELTDAIAALEGRPVRLLLGPQVEPREAWADAELVTTSPSINPDFPTTEPRLRLALAELVLRRHQGDVTAPALVSEPDLFLRLCPAPTIGVTGTKGKTTTSALTRALLATDPRHPVVLGGNMGTPIVERLADLTPDHRVVYELSELQLPTLSRGTTVALYTNVTADHLDRHGDLISYRAVKRRLAELVDPAGALILNADDPVVSGYEAVSAAPVVTYRLGPPLPGGLGLVEGWITASSGIEPLALSGGSAREPVSGRGQSGAGPAGAIMPVSALAIPGRHNVSNAMAAMAAGLLFGLDRASIRQAAAEFTGVEHRLETVATIDGVRFVNDSQGTQPDAVIAALEAFERPLILIAGGRDKGLDLTELGAIVVKRADAVILIGETALALERLFGKAGVHHIERAASLEAAVRRGDELAREALAGVAGGAGTPVPGLGATVLLSPAAASFDMFTDYEARGRAFKAAVVDLQHRRSA